MLTVQFSTFNGAHTLPRMLESLAATKVPRGGWRIVAADDGSTDATPAILESYRGRLPLVVVHEARRGLNAARNGCLAYREGDLIVFTDDDVLADPDWLVRHRDAADRHVDIDVFGGTILPHWEAEPPAWVLEAVPLGPAFALTPADRRTGPMPLRWAFGPNFAVRTRLFDGGLTFREDIGPRGRGYAMGAESELLARLEQQGAKGRFVAEAVVRHIVRPWQFDPRWLRRRARNYGRGRFHVLSRDAPDRLPRADLGVSPWLIRCDVAETLALAAAVLRRDPARAAALRWSLWQRRGLMTEIWRAARVRTLGPTEAQPPRPLRSRRRA